MGGKGRVPCLLMQLFARAAQKLKFAKLVFEIFNTHNYHPSYGKHVLPSICVLFNLFGH